jgi:hypothetical protein
MRERREREEKLATYLCGNRGIAMKDLPLKFCRIVCRERKLKARPKIRAHATTYTQIQQKSVYCCLSKKKKNKD